ncbi:MAG: hypothetical protein EP146_18260 [Oscillibacter sp.]|uniref:P27 family phage terminase small subunit n=1 Tax=Oscillibacter sp. TaxID=1945593 RepID=UPI001328CB5A|nr:P27 family phage terminase small subunit [Oscillibacter sp.]MUU13068.1 hypothetical protein [Oscillibacter sp.]
MGRIAITRETIKAQTVTAMKKMGTFAPEYEPIIEIYAGLREQYNRLSAEYSAGKSYHYATPTADGGAKKSPLSMTIESLRKDILLYSDRLMLNPRPEPMPQGETQKIQTGGGAEGWPVGRRSVFPAGQRSWSTWTPS